MATISMATITSTPVCFLYEIKIKGRRRGFLRHGRALLHDARVCAGQVSDFQANFIEEHVLLSDLLHFLVALKQTRDQKLSSDDERPAEFGHNGFDAAHTLDRLPSPVPQCRYCAVFLETSSLLVDQPDVLLDRRRVCSCGTIISS